MWSNAESINLAFAIIFFLLIGCTTYNLVYHSYKKRAAYIVLLIFDILRVVDNAILVAGAEESKSTNFNVSNVQSLLIAGYILQGIGYSFLVGATLRLYNRSVGYSKKREKQLEKATGIKKRFLEKPSRWTDIANIVATILISVGLSYSGQAFVPGSRAGVDNTAKAGAYVYCVMTVAMLIMTIYHLFIVGPITNASRTILTFIFVALIPMTARSGYIAYRFQESQVVNYNVWIHLVFQNIAEVVVVILYCALGFVLARTGDSEIDDRRELRYPMSTMSENTA